MAKKPKKNNRASRQRNRVEKALLKLEQMQRPPGGRASFPNRIIRGFLAFVALLGIPAYVVTAYPDIEIQPASLSESKRDPLLMPFFAKNAGYSTFRVETARCAAWEFDPASGAAGAPETENCTEFSGPKPVVSRGNVANLWPCFSGVSPAAQQIDVAFLVRAKTVGWLWWPWEVEKRDRWRVVRDGSGGYGVFKPTPLPSAHDNACSDEVMARGKRGN